MEEVDRRKLRSTRSDAFFASGTLYPTGDEENYNWTANLHHIVVFRGIRRGAFRLFGSL